MSPPRMLLEGSALAAAACLLCTVFGKVPAPQNVAMHSVNLKNILRWDPPIYQGGNLTYTVQYISSCIRGFNANHTKEAELRERCQLPMSSTNESGDGSNILCFLGFQDVCQRTALTECVFQPFLYGTFCLRVRAEFKNDASVWESISFQPLEQTTIGPPPDVVVKSRAGLLDVYFECPMYEFENRCLTEIYGNLLYTMRYWKTGMASQAKTVTTEQTYAILSELEPWTTYCLQVHASVPDYSKTGESSPVVCEKTSDDGHTPWWIKTVAFLLSLGVVAAVVTGVFFLSSYIFKATRYIFYPSCSFPQHLKEFLEQPIYNAPFSPMKSNEEENELCNKVTVVSEESGSHSINSASLEDSTDEESA